jgi:hypothetical protein
MSNFVQFFQHEISGPHMNLNMSRADRYIVNIDHIVATKYTANCKNGYDDENFFYLKISLSNNENIELYREDAETAWKLLHDKLSQIEQIKDDCKEHT